MGHLKRLRQFQQINIFFNWFLKAQNFRWLWQFATPRKKWFRLCIFRICIYYVDLCMIICMSCMSMDNSSIVGYSWDSGEKYISCIYFELIICRSSPGGWSAQYIPMMWAWTLIHWISSKIRSKVWFPQTKKNMFWNWRNTDGSVESVHSVFKYQIVHCSRIGRGSPMQPGGSLFTSEELLLPAFSNIWHLSWRVQINPLCWHFFILISNIYSIYIYTAWNDIGVVGHTLNFSWPMSWGKS